MWYGTRPVDGGGSDEVGRVAEEMVHEGG